MSKEKSLPEYDIKVLLALTKALQGDKLFFKFLAKNGYTELAAFSNSIRGDVEALKWLFANGFPILGVLSNAIGGEKKAVKWVEASKNEFLIKFSEACRGDNEAYMWFRERDLKIFNYMITEIKDVQKVQAKDRVFWYRWK